MQTHAAGRLRRSSAGAAPIVSQDRASRYAAWLHDLDGWRILARLKDDIATRHIPVYIITTEDAQARGLSGDEGFVVVGGSASFVFRLYSSFTRSIPP